MSALLADTFNVTAIDADKKVFQRVSRLEAVSQRFDIKMLCDYNSELFKPQAGDNLELLLTRTIDDNGHIEENPQFNPRLQSKLLDEYEYVMFGKVFKVRQPTPANNNKSEVYVSFGGLLLSLQGPPNNSLTSIDLDTELYLLIRKAQ